MRTVTLETDRPRVLRMSKYAEMRFEEKSGCRLAEMRACAAHEVYLLWAAMLEDAENHGEELTPEDVGKMFDTSNMDAAIEAMHELLEPPAPLAQSETSGGDDAMPLPVSSGDSPPEISGD